MTIFPTGNPPMGGIGQMMFPQGAQGIGPALQAASPLLLAMGAGLSSGQGALSGMPTGLALMMAQQEAKAKRDREQAATDALGGLGMPGPVMGGATVSGMGAPAPAPAASGASPRFSGTPSMTRGAPEMFAALEKRFALPAGYLDRSWQIESGRGSNMDNPNSSAAGHFQFIDSTAGQYGVNRGDLTSEALGASRLAADNASILRQTLGRDPTAGELYLAHQQGGGGAAKLLANPNARAADIVGEDAVRLNGGSPDMTAQDFAQLWMSKFPGTPAADPMQDPWMQRALKVMAMPGLEAGARAALQAQVEMRMQSLQGQEGISPNVAAQLGMQQWQAANPDPQEPIRARPGDVFLDPNTMQPTASVPAMPDFRQATPEEAAQYGAPAGQFGPDGRFYPINPPSGTSIVSDGKGGVTITQGSGVGGRGALTEGQSKDNVYLTMAMGALPELDKYEAALDGLQGLGGQAAGMVPLVGNFMKPEEYKLGRRAASEFGAAILRKESGAALTASDHEWLDSRYIPVAGDGPAVRATKKLARGRAIAGLRSGMNDQQVASVASALKSALPHLTDDQAKSIAAEDIGNRIEFPNAPIIGAVAEGHVYNGGDPNDPASWSKQQ